MPQATTTPEAPRLTHGQLSPADEAQVRQIHEATTAGHTDGADEFEAMALRLPADTDILGHAAWAQARRGNHERALELYDRIITLSPAMAEARWRRADRLVNLGRLQEALESYRDAQNIDNNSSDARAGIRYIQFLLKKGRSSSARPVAAQPPPTTVQEQNRLLNMAEFQDNRIRLASLPTALQLESTTKCNFACQTCSKGYDPYYAEDLQPAILAQVRKELIPANTRLSITGFGEPTLASNFDEILEMGLHNGSLVHFVTNLSLLTYERLELLTSSPVEIIISMDGATPETFERVRAGGSFEITLDKLSMIKRLRDIHLSQFVSHFSIHFVALRSNIHELPGVIRIASQYGIEHVGVLDYAFNLNDFDRESLRHDPALAAKWFGEARRVAAELGVPLRLPPDYAAEPMPEQTPSLARRLRSAARRLLSAPGRFPRRCWSPWSEPYIDTSGSVRPCCITAHSLGNIRPAGFAAVWNGWPYRLLRMRIHSPIPPLYCRGCMHPFGINGGNAGAAIAREGLFVKLFYFMEWRLAALAGRLRARLAPPPPAPAPNYHAGRPVKDAKTVDNTA